MALTDHADPPTDPGEPAADGLAGPEPTLVLEALRAHWGELSGLDQKLLLMRYFGNMTQEEIGGQLGVSPRRAGQLLQHALGALDGRLAAVCSRAGRVGRSAYPRD
jgi:DNA-directed RNA polymerase specialized sigma24 family protein